MVRNKKLLRTIASLTAVLFLSEIFFPSVAYALTGGPSQPEVQSFEPIGTNQMVDPFTGDFTYNIPLMDVGGYPLNISYHSGITMDQEASWVGLGWNINPGAINRNKRGLPDDFLGDAVTSEFNMKKNQTFGLSANFGIEVFGIDGKGKKSKWKPSFGLGVNYNTYNGVGLDLMAGVSPSTDLMKSGQAVGTAGLGLSMHSSSNDGLTISPSLSFSKKMDKKIKGLTVDALSSNVGVSINSRAGLTGMSYGLKANTSFDKTVKENGNKVKKRVEGSDGLSSSISFIPNTYVPQQRFPFESGNYSASFKFGGELFGLTGTFDLTGTYAYQKLKEQKKSTNAYGYMYSEYGAGQDTAMLDFNREKDRPFSRHTSNLPLTNFTYDLFGISGQGIGGMFRPHRSEIGYVHDPKVQNTSASFNLGLELGAGGIIKAGSDGSANGVNSTSGLWASNNSARGMFSFYGENASDLYEPYYFQMVGERTADDPAWASNNMAEDPVQVKLSGSSYNVSADAQLVDKTGYYYSPSTPLKRAQRAKRNQLVSQLTRLEVSNGMGLDNYTSWYAQNHHIGEITVLRNDGSRYIYGIPAYNYQHKEVSFNVSGNSGKNCQTGLIDYSSQDASVNNSKGKDNFYQSTSTPPYAHSYLLSALLSSDYSDFDGVKGPSDGDLGNYVKFEYDYIPTYKWRVPYEQNKASYDEGLASVASDDMGSYQYGEKELHYLKTIQTKTHIAVFHLSGRKDGYGVKDEHGGRGGPSMKKLDKISLYAISEYRKAFTGQVTPVPIMEVHFEYDYILCPGIPNFYDVTGTDSPAKLTLTGLYFTYGNSKKAKFSSYTFNYADTDHNGSIDANPSYNLKAYDRWGHYKPNTGNCGNASGLTAPEYPYVEQNKSTADSYAASWSLTDIDLPSGGKIEVDYESDDYAYVQNKRAMQMFKILGSGSNAFDFTPGSGGNSNVLYDGKTPKQYLFFQLQEPMPATSTVSDLRDKYFADIMDQHLYFRFLMNLNDTWADGNMDYVSGYAKVESVGFYGSAPYQYAYIKLKKVKKGDRDGNAHDAHPISRAAWNYARTHNPDLAHGSGNSHLKDNPGEAEVEDVFYELVDALNNFGDMIKGANGALRSKNYGRKFHKSKSWVRLYNPNGNKLGGGVRVKKLVMKDQWSQMTSSGTTYEYGQEYDYTLDDGRSSGVAAYEPMGGGDENPFRQPVFFSEERLLAPDDEHYIEKPFGESFFPSPSVGYSKVTVKNLQYANVTQHATGKIVHEFFTAKDHPTRTDHTDLTVKHKPANFLSKMLKFNVKEHMNTSQGYVVETNDMHGKPKAQWVYAEGQTDYLSGVQYEYQTETVGADLPFKPGTATIPQVERLDNTVKVLMQDNTITDREVGVTYDMVNDFRESYSKSHTGGLRFNVSTFLAFILPIAIPTIIPSYSKNTNQYRSAVTTKVINRFGIQKATVAYDQNSVIRTENTLWDAETGEVLLTKTENEYDDPNYALNLPAHLAYKGMRGAYQNIGYTEGITLNQDGRFSTDPDNSNFRKGDELQIYHNYKVHRAWVLEKIEYVGIDPVTEQKSLHVVDRWGNPLTDGKFIDPINVGTKVFAKVVRSGYRNQMSANIASFSMKENPAVNGSSLQLDKTAGYNPKILSASALEYDENWQISPPAFQESANVFDFYTECDTLDPDITDNVSGAFSRLLKDMALQDKLLGPLNTFTMNSVVAAGSHFTSADITTLQDNMETYIPGTVYISAELVGHTSSFMKDYTDGFGNVTYRMVQRRITHLILRFHNQDESLMNYARILINDHCDGTCPLSELDDEPIVDVVMADLGYKTAGKYLKICGCVSNGVIVEEPNGDSTAACPSGVLPFIVRKCEVVIKCPYDLNSVMNQSQNPYVLGIRGNYRPKRSFAYLSERSYTATPNLRQDATYTDFNSFWSIPITSGGLWPKNSQATHFNKWANASEVTRMDEFGNEIENKDALDVYSSALFAFNGSLPVAVANNSQFGQMAYESYEDYASLLYRCKSVYEYFGIREQVDTGGAIIAQGVAHTGLHSLEIRTGETVTYTTTFKTTPCTPQADDVPYTFKDCDRIGVFGEYDDQGSPLTFKISFWVNEKNATRVFDYDDISVSLTGPNLGPVVATLIGKSEIIEGWQKREYSFTIPAGTDEDIDLEFQNTGSVKYYLDDLRIQPMESSMKSYAYNPDNLRFMAELDENNFATFYEYDEEGALVRIKKETERGIETIQENTQHAPRP